MDFQTAVKLSVYTTSVRSLQLWESLSEIVVIFGSSYCVMNLVYLQESTVA